MRRCDRSSYGLALAATALVAAPARSAVTYRVTDLGPAGTAQVWGRAVNDSGQVAGYLYFAGAATTHGFAYSGGRISDLGTFGGSSSHASGINAAGVVVGDATDSAGVNHAFLYDGTTLADLGTLGGTKATANDINDLGQVVGTSWTAGDADRRAFLWDHGQMTSLGTLPGAYGSSATGINNAGQVTGFAYTAANSFAHYHAFVYAAGGMRDLGTLGGTVTYPWDINEHGDVVGYAFTTGDSAYHAFVYSDGTMTDLGTLGGARSFATGINDAGQVVGYSDPASGSSFVPFVFANGHMTNLNQLLPRNSGWTLTEALGINNLGQIIAVGSSSTSSSRTVLLTPTPEPGWSIAAIAPLLFRGRRRP